MKRTQVIILLAISSVLLFGCGDSGTKKTVTPVIKEPIIEESPAEDTSESEVSPEEDVPPSEGMVRSRITNEWVPQAQNDTRPIAIMIPNSSTASFFGLSKASVLYEVNVEGSMTRLMAIIDDWQDMEKLGNIRSCRDYFVYWGFEWDAIYIHYGGPFYIDDVISREDTQNINCISYPDVYFNDEARNTTDNAFTSGAKIKKAMEHFGYTMSYRDGYADDEHYKFAAFNSPNTLEQYDDSMEAEKIDMSECYPVTNCYFVYNEETGLYDRFQKLSGATDGPHIDMANDEQLSFKNIIVQSTYHEVRDQKGYLAFQVHDTERGGWYFTNGRGIHINWKKVSDYGATRYYDDAGNEIELNTGKTMVLIIEDKDSFKVDQKSVISK